MEAADFTQCATHGSFSRRWQETLYNMFHFITLYVLPLLVMSCCYSRILLHIHLQHLRDKGKELTCPLCGQVEATAGRGVASQHRTRPPPRRC